jgi:hypothetical protein
LEIEMNVMDILQPYAQRPTDTHQDFDEVATQVPVEALGAGITDAFRSDLTPDFGSMVASLFGGSNAQQKAGLIGQLLRAVGPSVLSSLGGGLLGRLLKGSTADRVGSPQGVSANDVAQVTADQVRDIAVAAEKEDPSILDRVGAYYAQHPEVVKVLGGAALAIALGRVATSMQRR